VAAIGEGRKERRVLWFDVVAEAVQLHVVDDARLQKADQVGRHRHAVTRPLFFGDGAAPDERAPLEDERPPARAGQIEGSDEAVVAPADDDCVVSRHARDSRSRRGLAASRDEPR